MSASLPAEDSAMLPAPCVPYADCHALFAANHARYAYAEAAKVFSAHAPPTRMPLITSRRHDHFFSLTLRGTPFCFTAPPTSVRRQSPFVETADFVARFSPFAAAAATR